MEERTALFGGTFNPIHFGHLRVAEEVRERLGLRRVIFLPSNIPPLKTEDLVGSTHRFSMVKEAIRGNSYFEVSDLECRRQGRSFTVDTLDEYRRLDPGKKPLFILGADAFLDIPGWHEPERLVALTDFVIVNRPGYSIKDILQSPFIGGTLENSEGEGIFKLISGRLAVYVQCSQLEISASDIRRRIKSGRSIKYLLPESVEFYIISKGLYSGSV